MKLIPYLNFDGNCEEVLNTYQKIFDGKIEMLSRFGDNSSVGDEQKDKIMHARLLWDDNMLMFSDTMPGRKVSFGDSVTLSIGLTDEAQAYSVFNQLAEGGTVTMPMAKQFWGAIFGMLIDKFGIQWMINCEL